MKFSLSNNVTIANAKNLVMRNATDLTAYGYLAGHFLEGVTGLTGMEGGLGSPFEQRAASTALIAGAVTMRLAGKKDAGFATALALDQVGLYFAMRQGMADGQVGVIAGFALNAVGAGFAVMGSRLEQSFRSYGSDLIGSTEKLKVAGAPSSQIILQQFKESGAKLVRNTLGSPRKMTALSLSASNAPLVVDAVVNQQWAWLGVVSCYVFADAMMFLSKSEADQKIIVANDQRVVTGKQSSRPMIITFPKEHWAHQMPEPAFARLQTAHRTIMSPANFRKQAPPHFRQHLPNNQIDCRL